MREILFRGKRVDNNEWVEGFYVNVPEHYKQEMSGKSYIVSINNGLFMEVVHESVGEYTGLTDKNGKRIFEGDITQYDKDGALYEIVFVKEGGKTQFCSKFIPDGSLGYVNGGRDKVIGNIHDNPELLEMIK